MQRRLATGERIAPMHGGARGGILFPDREKALAELKFCKRYEGAFAYLLKCNTQRVTMPIQHRLGNANCQ